MDEMLLPKVTRVGPHSIVHKNWKGKPKGMTVKYKWKKRPYHHQVVAIKTLLGTGFGGALLMEPRTGKTKTAIDYASILHLGGKVNRVLIFCPVSVMGVWEEQLEENCPFPYTVTIWDRKARKLKPLPKMGRDVIDFVIINYDALSTPGRVTGKRDDGSVKRSRSVGGRFTVYKQLEAWQPQLIILDESHRIKSASAKKSTMIHKLGEVADYRVILTGTVVTKKKRIFDIYSQWKFLNPTRFGNMTLGGFKSEFGVWTSRNGYPQWLRNKNEKKLHDLIHEDSFAITREECYDLPARLPPEFIRVPLDKMAKIYDEMAEEMVAKIHTGEYTEASIRLVQGLRLQQITSGLVQTTPSPQFPKGRLLRVGTEKLDVLRDRLEDLFEADEKVVIAARFVADLHAIVEICESLNARTFLLKGGIKREQRDADRRAFQEYEGAAAFVLQPQAGSLGIDLSTAGTFIWYSLTSSFVDYSQSEDRIALSSKATRYIYILAENTYDEVMYETLQEDGDVVKAVMASPERLLRERS